MLRPTPPILNFARKRPVLCGPAFFNRLNRIGFRALCIAAPNRLSDLSDYTRTQGISRHSFAARMPIDEQFQRV
jgi:hypothetical protein